MGVLLQEESADAAAGREIGPLGVGLRPAVPLSGREAFLFGVS